MFQGEETGVRSLMLINAAAGALLGGIHCLAWQFSFPSRIEQIMWRAASLALVGSCAVIFCIFILVDFLTTYCFVVLLLGGLSSFIYSVARIILLVLTISSLRSLPPSAYDVIDWVELVPHI